MRSPRSPGWRPWRCTKLTSARATPARATDSLTGLGNRRALEDELERVDGMLPLSLLLLDFDGLKAANDVLGYAAGDRLIVESARALAARRRRGAGARLGGDEFVAVLPGIGEADALQRGAQIAAAVDAVPFPPDLAPLFQGASHGAVGARPGEPPAELLLRAARDMHRRKAERRQVFRDIVPGVTQLTSGRTPESAERKHKYVYACRDLEQVLVLNASYEPLNVCSVRRARRPRLEGQGGGAREPRPAAHGGHYGLCLATRDPATGYTSASPGRSSGGSPGGRCSPATAPAASIAATRRIGSTLDHWCRDRAVGILSGRTSSLPVRPATCAKATGCSRRRRWR